MESKTAYYNTSSTSSSSLVNVLQVHSPQPPPHIEAATGILDHHHPLSSPARRPHDLNLGGVRSSTNQSEAEQDQADSYMTDTDPLLHRPTIKVRSDGGDGDVGVIEVEVAAWDVNQRVDDDCPLLDA